MWVSTSYHIHIHIIIAIKHLLTVRKKKITKSTLYICHCLFQIYLQFLEYQMENSNECKKNFVAVYDGSNAIEDLKVIYV